MGSATNIKRDRKRSCLAFYTFNSIWKTVYHHTSIIRELNAAIFLERQDDSIGCSCRYNVSPLAISRGNNTRIDKKIRQIT